MLTRISIKSFRFFDSKGISLPLTPYTIINGKNNSGKTSILHAFHLLNVGTQKFVAKKGKVGVIDRLDIDFPLPDVKMLWHNLKVRDGRQNIPITINVTDDNGKTWEMNFVYANERTIYAKPSDSSDYIYWAEKLKCAFLSPAFSVTDRECRLDSSAIRLKLAQGKASEVLRNLCWEIASSKKDKWKDIVLSLQKITGIRLKDPLYIKERGEILLDLTFCSSGFLQMLLFVTQAELHPGNLLLLDGLTNQLDSTKKIQFNELIERFVQKGGQVISTSI